MSRTALAQVGAQVGASWRADNFPRTSGWRSWRANAAWRSIGAQRRNLNRESGSPGPRKIGVSTFLRQPRHV